jgi:aromatic-amino-acid transaminase
MLHVIASHQSRPSDDPIFALNREAKLAVLPTAARAVHEVPAGEWAAYAPISGTPAFLEAVVDDLLDSQPALHGVAIASATPGGSGALRQAIANFLEPGQALLTTSFYWGPYQTMADEADCRVDTFSMFDAATRELDVAALDRALARQIAEQRRVLLFVNDPCHNPTGYSMHADEWQKVVACLLSHAGEAPITLLVDCAYFAYSAADPRAFLKELVPLAGRVMLLFAWSASKTFTHYGLRVGALVACIPDEAERRTTEAALSYSSRGMWSNCTRGGQLAIARLLSDPALAKACDAERAKLKAMLRARVDAWNGLARPKGLDYPRYDGGFFVTVFHPAAIEKAAEMKRDGVFVVPQKGALRVALCGVAERDVARLVDSLAGA